MEDKFPCDRHDEKIHTLFKKTDSINRRVEKIEEDRKFLYSLDKNMAIQTQMMKEMIEHNKKQDERMDKQEEIIVKINTNLTELNEGQKALNRRVGKLEERVNENDNLHRIDTRKIEKKRWEDIFYKVAVPSGIAILLILEILRRII